jgi:hypothetical protein
MPPAKWKMLTTRDGVFRQRLYCTQILKNCCVLALIGIVKVNKPPPALV